MLNPLLHPAHKLSGLMPDGPLAIVWSSQHADIEQLASLQYVRAITAVLGQPSWVSVEQMGRSKANRRYYIRRGS
jgi:hypothetical protein